MTWSTNGLLPTEFDKTTDRLMRTVASFGVEDEAIRDDQDFLVNLMASVSNDDPNITMQETIWVMDVAFIGLLYHRHMPFLDEDDVRFNPERGAADYTFTLTAVSNAIVHQLNVTKEDIVDVSNEVCARVLRHLRRPDDLSDPESLILHRQWLALSILGMIIHRFIPSTSTHP